MRQFGHVEAAVGVNKRRGVGAAVFADVEIRYLRAVCRTRPKLPYGDAVCVELFGLAAQDTQFVYLQVECVQGQRGGEVACGDVEQVAAPRLVGQLQRTLRQFGQGLFLPCFARPFPCFQTAFNVVEQGNGDKAFGGFHAFYRLRVVGCEQQGGLAQFAFVEFDRHKRAGGVAFIGTVPRLHEFDQELSGDVAGDFAIGRQFECGGAAV